MVRPARGRIGAAILGAVARPVLHIVRPALAALAIFVLAPSAIASAGTLSFHNPLRDPRTGMPLSCPDPSVSNAPPPSTGYYLVCTSGFGPDAFPIYASHDLVHWQPHGFVFPKGHQPWWAVHSTGRSTGGRYWAPELERIGGRWVVYFAAEYNSAKLNLQIPGHGRVTSRRMMIGYATARSLAGPWQSGVLHYAGQLSGLSSAETEQEAISSAIDPGVVQDPATGQLYMYWSDQPHEIWAGKLDPGGTILEPPIRRVLRAGAPFECDPRDHHCTIEAPEPFYANGSFYLLYSGASTWDSSYAVGVASSPGPFGPFAKLGHPILHQGDGFYSTGHTSDPVLGPDGGTYILYHARTKPGVQRPAATRYLMLGQVTWADGWPRVSAP
jgi:beta-xylosidase